MDKLAKIKKLFMAEERIDIRDLRDGKFLWVGKPVLEFISRKSGSTAVTVYVWLCYYANVKGQDCFPSVTTLSRHCAVSRRTIIRMLKNLEQLKVIAIDRTKGKSNVYTLMNVDVEQRLSTGLTGDIDVTSDMGDTTPVSVVSPVVVTPGIPEQYRNKQYLLNNTQNGLFDLWKTAKNLPYAKPTDECVKELEVCCAELLEDVNLYSFMFTYQMEKGYPPNPEAMVKLCKDFKRDRTGIKKPAEWFKNGLEMEAKQLFV
jgi:hypothetical protein